ncbi:MAG: hypothetical protein J3Q66DRAFT_445598 [Benniella sp.]|nr:MAG: hypothetical protein J3Q66DRAFT_445598 [Benniella sp.]
MTAIQPPNTPTQRQILLAAASRPEVKRAIGLSAFVRLQVATAHTLTTDRQQGYRGIGRRLTRANLATGEAVLTGSIDEALQRLSGFSRLLKPKSLTRIREKHTFSHDIFEPVDEAEWARVSGIKEILDYHFRDRSLLITALRPVGGLHARGVTTSDRLEYLGDSFLELAAALLWLLEGRGAIADLKGAFCLFFTSIVTMAAVHPHNILTQGQIFQAAAGKPELTKAIGTCFMKMAFGLLAFMRLPQGTAEALTTDRQRGY